ncbi:hypothetical protein RhiTH_010948 [Rhizoctonia solani]
MNILDEYDGKSATTDSGPTEDPTKPAVRANLEVNLPINLDPLEKSIVHNQNATIVVGRSGTGKTTALVYRMRAIHLQDQASTIRQMVVTRSRVLAKHIEATFLSLIESTSVANKTEAELAVMAEQYKQRSDPALIEFDNELDLREDLPPRFSLLEDSHFPLFISFDKVSSLAVEEKDTTGVIFVQLCSLLEADLIEYEQEQKQCKMPILRSNIIDLDVFESEYWPKFRNMLKFNLNPAFVYSEIMGVIKGSSKSRQDPNGFLSRDEYLAPTRKKLNRTDPGLRAQIYDLFGHYNKIKGERFERDPADRTRPLLKFIANKANNIQEWHAHPSNHLVDFLYVDEVQDNLMMDIHLLGSLCTSVQNTYWAGDTAQTIVAGSAFRIKDLGPYLFGEGAPTELYDSKPMANFTRFNLTGNFRSHTGIVNCAASIVDALYKHFPNSLDHMDPETSRWRGPPPVAFIDTDSEVCTFEQFLLGSSGSHASFGAQQAIIVRSEAVAQTLSPTLAELCPILSITNCKGLEFDDVIIYNFFASSEAPDAWDFVHGSPLKAHRNSKESVPPVYLCNDLKLLYVAITRARKRCWMWDHGPVNEAMQKFWLSQGLITTKRIFEAEGWGSVSSPKEWIEKGQEYSANGMYRLASACLKRGGENSRAQIAMAYHQMSRAKAEMLRGDSRESRSKLCQASRALDACGMDEENSGQIQSARHLRFHSATCLELAHEVREAAKMLIKAGYHEQAIRTLFRQQLIRDGVVLLLAHGSKLGSAVEQELLDYCRMHYFSKCNYELLPPLFKFNVEEQLSYARQKSFRPQLKFLLDQHKRFAELAEIHREDRMLTDALEYFIKDFCEYDRSSSLEEGAKIVFCYSETVFGLESKKSANSINCMRIMLGKLFPHLSSLLPKQRRKFTLFDKLLDRFNDPNWAWIESEQWDQFDSEERIHKTMLVHLSLSDMGWLKNHPSPRRIRDRLAWWMSYNSLIITIVEDSEPSRLPTAQRLLGFNPFRRDLLINSQFIVSKESVIYELSKKERVPTQQNSNGDILFPARWIDKLIKDGLRIPLERRLRQIHNSLNDLGLFKAADLATNACAARKPASPELYSCLSHQDKVKILLLGLSSISSICDVLLSICGPEKTQPSVPRLWIQSLFDTIYSSTGLIREFDPTWLCDHSLTTDNLVTFLKKFISSVGPEATFNTGFSSLVIGHSLVMCFRESAYEGNIGPIRLNNSSHTCRNQLDDLDLNERLMGDYISSFFDWSDFNGLTNAITTLR